MDERLTHRPANPNMANGTPTVPMKRFSMKVASRWFMPARRKWKTELKLHCRARDRNTWPAADGTAMVSSCCVLLGYRMISVSVYLDQ
jgi:hypothetical protein